MSDIKITYGASTTIGITLTGLATNSLGVLTTGQESNYISNSGNNLDVLLGGKISVGSSPTASRQIEIWVYGSIDDSPTYPDALDGSDSSEVILGDRNATMKLFQVISTDSTSNKTYWFGPSSVSSSFGGYIPKYWGVFVCHNTAVSLNTSGTSHSISYTPIYESIN